MQLSESHGFAILFDLYRTLIDISVDEDSLAFWGELLVEPSTDDRAADLRKFYRERCQYWSQQISQGDSVLEHVFPEILCSFSVGDASIDEFAERFRRRSRRLLETRAYTRPLIAQLSEAGYKTGIISNTEALLTRVDLLDLDLLELVDVIVLSSDVGIEKPSPEPFRVALEVLSVDPERSLFVGDSVVDDVCGALGAGMFAGHVGLNGVLSIDESDGRFLGSVAPEEGSIMSLVSRFRSQARLI